MSDKVVMTKEGHFKLEEDLRRMRGVETREILNTLSEAREKGDLSENSEYDAAKEAYEMLNIRIQKFEQSLSKAVILDRNNVDVDSVQVLTTVRLKDVKTKKIKEFTIVPSFEIDLKNGKISMESPLCKAIIGKKVNEVVSVKIPSGDVEYKIMQISI